MRHSIENRLRIALAIGFALASPPRDAGARTLHILPDGHGDVPTIQGAIDIAATGDTVLVAAGRYLVNLRFRGRNIVLRSESGAASTTLDGSGQDSSVVVFEKGESRSCVVRGFTISNGRGSRLGTSVSRAGGGIFINDAEPMITENVIASNQVISTGFGGGIFVVKVGISGIPRRPLISNNTITLNYGSFNAGGIGGEGVVAPEIVGNTISNNMVGSGDGGGVWIITYADGSIIRNNRIERNEVGDHGGGIYAGSGAFAVNHRFEISYNLVVANSAHGEAGTGDSGGGVWLATATGEVANNTIVLNAGDGAGNAYGGGVVLLQGSNPIIERNIIALSTVGGGLYCHQPEAVSIRDNLVWGNAGGDGVGQCADWYTRDGNIQADPLFCNAAAGDYNLPPNSPARTHPMGPLGAFPAPGCTNGVPVIVTTWSAIKLLFH